MASSFFGFAVDAIIEGTPQFGAEQKGVPSTWRTVANYGTEAQAIDAGSLYRQAIAAIGPIDVLGNLVDVFIANVTNEYHHGSYGYRVVATWTLVIDPFVTVNPP